MFEEFRKAKAVIKETVARLDPQTLDARFAAELVDEFAELERVAAAGKALAARRVKASGAWKREGDRTPAHWMARTTKSTVGDAMAVLETAEAMEKLPATEQAVRAGELSQAQAVQVVSAASVAPDSEKELLQAAESESVAGLRQRCQQVKAAALCDEVARYEAIRKRRRLRHYTDTDGAFRLDVLLTPDAGAALLAGLEPYRNRVIEDARKQGRKEAYEASSADALLAMAEHARTCDNNPQRKAPAAMVHVRVDHSALLRGETKDGETCEIPGVGPIPVATARALSHDAFLCALAVDGTDITAVSHLGRTIPARLRTALNERDRSCAVLGCDVAHDLEIDHCLPVHQLGPGELKNCDRYCKWHHYLKTHHGYRPVGPPGQRRLLPPEHPRPPNPRRRRRKRSEAT